MLRPWWNLTHLPGPEPPILCGVHTCKREITEPILECLIPVLPIDKSRAIPRICSRVPDTQDEQATVVNPITELTGDSDSEGTLTDSQVG